MAMTLSLTREESDVLRSLAAESCNAEDMKKALGRCPGAPLWDRVVPNIYDMDTLTDKLLQSVGLVSPYLPSSFLLRLMEQAWALDKVRRVVSRKLPSLVRPPRGVIARVETLTSALAEMPRQLPPLAGGSSDDGLFERLCRARKDIHQIVESLALFAALKEIHDALHTLQVLGGDWLNLLARPDKPPDSVGVLLALLARVTAVTMSPAVRLPVDVIESCIRCREASADADQRIRSGNADDMAFACATLRAILIREPRVVDAAMFAVSREFPLAQFCALFEDTKVHEAAFDLGDTLRRRLMEHTLWQATDQNLYQIEQILAAPSQNWMGELTACLPWTNLYLNALFDEPTRDRVIGPMKNVLERFVLGAEGSVPDGIAKPTVADICAVFADLRNAARSAFLDVDRTLRDDFSLLLKLKEPFTIILSRVPENCELFL